MALRLSLVFCFMCFWLTSSYAKQPVKLRVATFNVSMESNNYIKKGELANSTVLAKVLATGEHSQVRNIAEIIQRVNPDVILLNEFDYLAEAKGIKAFINNYLAVSQKGMPPIAYPYFYVNTVNTGKPSPYDLNNDGKKKQYGDDAYGYGLYEGQYGMAILSKYPILEDKLVSLQTFKWQDMPDAQRPFSPDTNTPWYDEDEWNDMPLSSKSHWDVPIDVNGKTIHLLAMHPTPPNFDGNEDRNGKRNHDEIRLMADYLTPNKGNYIYDVDGEKVGLDARSRFVLVGDFNAADIGDKYRKGVIEQLTQNALVNGSVLPTSQGGKEASDDEYSARYTAYWGARADYVLPSKYGLKVVDSGVFWPAKSSPLYRLVKDRKASSDHRLVWVDLLVQ